MQMAGTILPIQPEGIALAEPLLRVPKSSGLISSRARFLLQEDAKMENYDVEVARDRARDYEAWAQKAAA